jgi:glycosyltransferase involved in cell wall biosynthesis
MNVVLDNIIFSLQKSGGISVYWQQHLINLLKDKNIISDLIEFENVIDNFFRQQLIIDEKLIHIENSQLLFFKRYINLIAKNDHKHIFHSSYYRTEKGSNTINVTTVHDFTYEYYSKGLSRKLHSWQKNAAINNSDGIICISENTKKDLLRFLPHINEDKLRVIYNGVDPSFRNLKENIFFEKQHNFDDYSYVLYIGDRRAKYKNFEMAVKACSLSCFPLLIIGGGKLTQNELHYLNSKLGNGNFQIILGVSVEDLNFYYNRAYCLLYPSLYEGFGIPVVEAQRAGCPVIATNSSSIPEIIGNNYLVIENPNSEKIARKIKELSNNFLREEIIELGFEKSEKFSWKNTYKQTIEFYKELYEL